MTNHPTSNDLMKLFEQKAAADGALLRREDKLIRARDRNNRAKTALEMAERKYFRTRSTLLTLLTTANPADNGQVLKDFSELTGLYRDHFNEVHEASAEFVASSIELNTDVEPGTAKLEADADAARAALNKALKLPGYRCDCQECERARAADKEG